MSADVQAAPPVDVSAEPLKPVACFGRYMIDVPPGAEVLGLNTTYRFGDFKSERTELDAKGFEALMLKRQEVVKSTNIDRYKYVETRRGGRDQTDWIFISNKDVFGENFLRLEVHALRGNVHFSVVPELVTTIDDAVARVNDAVLSQMRARQLDEVPTDPGLCIQDGFIASGGSSEHGERVQLSMRFKRWPDVSVSVESQMIYKAEPGLLERINSAPVPAIFMSLISSIKQVRRGLHDVGPIVGEESLDILPTDYGYKIHAYTWESHFVVNDPYKPALTVNLHSGRTSDGKKQRPTISDQDAIQLFDAVVNSIRLRPTSAPPAKVSEAPPLTPLGELAATGRPCPQTGWWQSSEDAQKIQGGPRQFFRAGERLPHAVVLGEPSMWQKFKGEQPSYRVATVWKLVGYEEPEQSPVASTGQTQSGQSNQPDQPAGS